MEKIYMKRPIVILTDFGTADPFVGIMKGVIRKISPQTPIIDLTQDIPPGDIRKGAVTLWQSVDYFPDTCIFLVIIDPGVGTKRRAIILQTDNQIFIAPDNGVLSFIYGDKSKAWEISNPKYALSNPGMTFHGRDIFAPAAAHASLGVLASKFGDMIIDLKLLEFPRLERTQADKLAGQILHSDRFGNILTSLGKFTRSNHNELNFKPWINQINPFKIHPNSLKLELSNGTLLPCVNTFADIPSNKCGVILGSTGLLEIAANRQSAANLLNLRENELVYLRFTPI